MGKNSKERISGTHIQKDAERHSIATTTAVNPVFPRIHNNNFRSTFRITTAGTYCVNSLKMSVRKTL
jgi:hypothetical protein